MNVETNKYTLRKSDKKKNIFHMTALCGCSIFSLFMQNRLMCVAGLKSYADQESSSGTV